MTKYTDDDVQRLVEAAQAVCDHLHGALLTSQLLPQYVELENALAPFQPDPDAELIEKISEAMDGSGDWHDMRTDYQERIRADARIALAVIRGHNAKAKG